ncbi:MAG: ribosome small subunit-dependent GTPase A [Metallibacterium sp.]
MHGSDPFAALVAVGWPPAQSWPVLDAEQRVARVAAQHRAGYVLHDGMESFKAQPAPAFLRRGLAPEQRPVVGDFVIVIVVAGKPPQIVEILPRRSLLSRAAAGERYARQPIAANVDSVCVLMGLDGDFNPARVQRYLALIEGSGAQAVILLSKADVHPDHVAQAAALAAALPVGVAVLAINAKDAALHAQLAPWLLPGATLALVGSSGAGKSTLTNTLLGHTAQATAAVRAHDSRGRHTTTFRALLPLPGGACLIDTPGMRELKLTGSEDLVQYADIEALARQCRFSDCAHGNEPGCAVRAALDSGELSAARWHSYLKLSAEREQQEAALEAQLRRHANPRPARVLGRRQREPR